MSIVVTGATGQLGRLVIDELLERVPADRIAAAVRDADKAADFAARGVELRIADYSAPETLKDAFHPGDTVLLISSNDLEGRLPQHTAVIDAAKEAGVALLAYTGVLGGPEADFELASAHRETEKLILASGLPYTFLRNGWYTENYTRQLPQVLEHGAVVGSAGEGRVATASRRDYAAAAAVVLAGEGHENTAYELSGDVAWSLTEYAAEVTKQAGKDVVYTDLPVDAFHQVLTGSGMPEAVAAVFTDVDVAISRGRLAITTGDLARLIGRPTTTLAVTVAEALKS
ncbi:SDR family oxidoreductase [Streptomyces sp. H10-C2]|uniref:SDR family oxidoreductase n=1 Tax=unclassified Streptomyces TaxID=2593676 RepID=UPI0024BA0F7A|nr:MULTISPECIES: SDR family oxidoreductase [unclassified Streptomyces]MDJ0342018.1 SDR family oxidoreductase [Streptomyces sp. PH10-H1]MDJ0369991.1 SDR family oxidoreductase [Streptomyces sp. H10-C2]MDJ0370008.1 SDR family oxidoreductase [Streptomyces sp. H10-C2]